MQHFFSPTLGDLALEAADARSTGKHAVLIMYTRDDCSYCERMKANILALQGIQDYFRKNFALLAIDTRGAVPITDFAGKPTTERRFAQAQGVKLTPTLVFYGFDGAPLARVAGEIRAPQEFVLLGEFVATGAYRKTSFTEYNLANKKGL